MIVITDNACVNNSLFCATYSDTASVLYFGVSHLATLDLFKSLHKGVPRPTMPYENGLEQLMESKEITPE